MYVHLADSIFLLKVIERDHHVHCIAHYFLNIYNIFVIKKPQINVY